MSDETSDASKPGQSSNTPKPGEGVGDGKPDEGFWYIEGKPTRVLSINEYRDWVRKDIASKILTKLAAIFSVFGVGAITAFYFVLQNSSDTVITRLETEVLKVEERLENQLDEKIDTLERDSERKARELKAELQDRISDQIVVSLVEKGQLAEEAERAVQSILNERKEALVEEASEDLRKTLEALMRPLVEAAEKKLRQQINASQIAKDAVSELQNSEDYQTKIADVLSDIYLESGQLHKLFIEEARNIIRNRDNLAELRTHALSQIMLLARDEKERHDILWEVLENPEEPKPLHMFAVSLYRPTQGLDSANTVLEAVLSRFSQAEATNDNERSKYIAFLSRYPSESISKLADWIELHLDELPIDIVLSGMLGIQGSAPVEQVVSWIEDEANLASVGWRGLAQISPKRELETETRHRLLRRTLAALKTNPIDGGIFDSIISTQLEVHVNRLFVAIRNESRHEIEILRSSLRSIGSSGLEQLHEFLSDPEGVMVVKDAFSSPDEMLAWIIDNDLEYGGGSSSEQVHGALLDGLVSLMRGSAAEGDWAEVILPTIREGIQAGGSQTEDVIRDQRLTVLLGAWGKRLQQDSIDGADIAQQWDNLFNETVKLNDHWVSQSGSGFLADAQLASVLAITIDNCSEDCVRRFFENFESLYTPIVQSKDSPLRNGRAPLSSAVERLMKFDDDLSIGDKFIQGVRGFSVKLQESFRLRSLIVAALSGQDPAFNQEDYSRTVTDLIQSSKESLETGDMKAAGFAVFGMNVLLALTEAEDRVIERSLEETNFHLLPDREPDRKLSQTIEASKLELSKEIRTLLDWIDGYQDAATSIEAGKLGTLIWRSGSDSRTTAHYVWVEISSDADTGYVLRAMGPISEARPYHFMLVDQDNRVLDADVLPDDGLITIQSASAPRLLFVRFESGAKPENNLNIELVKITPVKEEFDPTNPLLVSVGQPYVREISSQADVWLKFSVLSGERYQIETYDLSDNVDTVIDRYESAYSESLERDDDGGGGLSSKMEIEPDITGDVFIKISDLNNSRTGSFNFILKKLQ